MLLRLAPALFVILWSTGFIASKIAVEYAEPFTVLALRFILVLVVLAPVVARLPWPTARAARDAAIAGALMHTTYIGGVLWALRAGMPAGLVTVVVCLQPVLTALLSGPLLGERIAPRHWAGLAIGLVGVALVLSPRLAATQLEGSWPFVSVLAAVAGLVGITFGTLWQKMHGQAGDLRALAFWQYVGAGATALPLAMAFETMHVAWSIDFALTMAWLVLVLSIGAIGLLLWLIRASAVSRVTSLFYLVPAVTALMAWARFGEWLTVVQFAGMGLVMLAVLLIGSLKSA